VTFSVTQIQKVTEKSWQFGVLQGRKVGIRAKTRNHFPGPPPVPMGQSQCWPQRAQRDWQSSPKPTLRKSPVGYEWNQKVVPPFCYNFATLKKEHGEIRRELIALPTFFCHRLRSRFGNFGMTLKDGKKKKEKHREQIEKT